MCSPVRSLRVDEATAGTHFRAAVESRNDGTSQVIYIDAAGPIHPPDDGNCCWHAQVAFTGLPWLKAAPKDDAATTAKFLAEDTSLDLVGFRPSSDRTGDRATPTKWCVEGSHQRFNNILPVFSWRGHWSHWVKVAQWVMRASWRPDRGVLRLYELVTGLKPQGPLGDLWRSVPPEPRPLGHMLMTYSADAAHDA